MHVDEPKKRVVVISPCRDEERTLERTIECMAAQTCPPERWVVVDDGSRDRTPEILESALRELPWLRVLRLGDRGYRRLGGGVIDAFNAGLETIDFDYDYVAKMDVDIEFGPTYLERALEYLEEDEGLAAVSGKVYRHDGEGFVEEFMIDEMVAGQYKLYSRRAFKEIGGFVSEVMWDGIDFHRARMMGFRTASLPDPELRIVHLRLMGSSDRSIYRGRLRWGFGQWFMGSTLPYVVASGTFRMREKPYVIGGLLIIVGFVLAAVRGDERYGDLEFRKNLRAWQWKRLRMLGHGRLPK